MNTKTRRILLIAQRRALRVPCVSVMTSATETLDGVRDSLGVGWRSGILAIAGQQGESADASVRFLTMRKSHAHLQAAHISSNRLGDWPRSARRSLSCGPQLMIVGS
jgi:hypothetical protein